MKSSIFAFLAGASLMACASAFGAGYDVKALVPGTVPFHGVHGMRFDKFDQLYAVSVIGESVYKVDTTTGKVTTFIGPPDGMADDLAFAPDDNTIAWTSIEDGIFHIKSPNGPIRRLMEHQRGVNGTAFSRDGKRLFVSLVFYGDALYEVDRNGVKPPRLVLKDIGGLNAFEVAEDGMIYGPLWFKGQLAKIDPDKATLSVIAGGFKTPASVKLWKGAAYVLDTGALDLVRVDLKTGQKKEIAKFPSDLDNMAFNTKGELYVSLSHANGIDKVDVNTGKVTELIKPAKLNGPGGLSVLTENGRDSIYVGDVFGGVRKVDGQSGAVSDVPVQMFQPLHISATAKHLVVVGQVNGFVQLVDRATSKKLGEWNAFQSPGDAIEAPNGDILVAETGAGNLVRITGPMPKDRKVVVSGLGGPIGLVWAGPDAVYVSEVKGGQITRVDLKTGAKSVVAAKLAAPEGIAIAPDGALLVVEVAGKKLTRIDVKSGARSSIAENLPVGLSNGPSLYRGLTVSASAIYVNSDIENAIYKITAKK